jgi:hypothetical protein
VEHPAVLNKGQTLKHTDQAWRSGHFHNSEVALGVRARAPFWERYSDNDHARITSAQFSPSGKKISNIRASRRVSIVAQQVALGEADGKDHTLEVIQVCRTLPRKSRMRSTFGSRRPWRSLVARCRARCCRARSHAIDGSARIFSQAHLRQLGLKEMFVLVKYDNSLLTPRHLRPTPPPTEESMTAVCRASMAYDRTSTAEAPMPTLEKPLWRQSIPAAANGRASVTPEQLHQIARGRVSVQQAQVRRSLVEGSPVREPTLRRSFAHANVVRSIAPRACGSS